MHVNISVMQLSRASFLTTLQDIMSSTNISPKNLSLEITESGLAENQGIFSRNLEANFKSSLTAMILNISKSIDTYAVAEGIETEMQAKLLNELDCQLGQGYYFGRPVPYESWQSS